ncbi:MAG: hypothetical protein JKY93_02375 [Gammaproteobacteria bacterium]|nr:hypothetical protein [Gammaproteobacteria bacterium]
MEIRNTTPCNQSIHAAKGKGIQVKPLLCIPGDGALYISDEEFGEFYASECEAQVKAGIFKIGLDTVESPDDVLQREADELAAAIKLVAKFAKQEEIKVAKHNAAKELAAEKEAAEAVAADDAEKARVANAGVGSVKGEPEV